MFAHGLGGLKGCYGRRQRPGAIQDLAFRGLGLGRFDGPSLLHLPFLAQAEGLLEEDEKLGLSLKAIVAGGPAPVAVGVDDGTQTVVARGQVEEF